MSSLEVFLLFVGIFCAVWVLCWFFPAVDGICHKFLDFGLDILAAVGRLFSSL